MLAGGAVALLLVSVPVATAGDVASWIPPATPGGASGPGPGASQPPGTAVQVSVGDPATLGWWTAVSPNASRARRTWDRPGVRTAVVGSGAAEPAVTVDPGAANVLGTSGTTRIAAGLQGPADDPTLGDAAHQQIGWLLSQAPSLVAASDDPHDEAAAIQQAVWVLEGSVPAEHGLRNEEVEARANALVASSAGRSLTTAVTVSTAAQACLDQPQKVSVQGPPGAVVSLTTTGPVALLDQAVTLDASGAGSTLMDAREPGAITIDGATPGSQLVRLNTLLPSGIRTAPWWAPAPRLAILTIQPVTVHGTVQVTGVDCGQSPSSSDDGLLPGTIKGQNGPTASVAGTAPVGMAPVGLALEAGGRAITASV